MTSMRRFGKSLARPSAGWHNRRGFSYRTFRFWSGRAGEHLSAAAVASLMTGKTQIPSVRAVCWLKERGDYLPVLAVERGQEVVSHLVGWSEGYPEDWFQLHVEITPAQYSLALMPDLQKSVDRYREARRALHGEVVPADTTFKIICRPLCFTSRDVGAIAKVQRVDRLRIGFVDWSDEDPSGRSPTNPTVLGPFRVNVKKSGVR